MFAWIFWRFHGGLSDNNNFSIEKVNASRLKLVSEVNYRILMQARNHRY